MARRAKSTGQWPGEAPENSLRSRPHRRTAESSADRRRRVRSSVAENHGGKRQGDHFDGRPISFTARASWRPVRRRNRLCGPVREPAWMAAMIRKYGEAAKSSGARIVFSCGSTPFLRSGSLLSRAAGAAKFGSQRHACGAGAENERHILRGTAASLLATVEAAAREPAIRRLCPTPLH